MMRSPILRSVLCGGALCLQAASCHAAALEETPLVQLLQSSDAAIRARGYELAVKEPALSSDEIRALVASFRYADEPLVAPHYSPYGPETSETRSTQIIVSHGDQASPFLLDALLDSDWNTRRFAAFCLGRISRKEAIPHLRRALAREINRASHSTIKVGDGREVPFMAVLGAMIDAYAQLDEGDAFAWSADLFVSRDRDFLNFVANYALSRIVQDIPPALVDEGSRWSPESKECWLAWWRENGAKPRSQRAAMVSCRE